MENEVYYKIFVNGQEYPERFATIAEARNEGQNLILSGKIESVQFFKITTEKLKFEYVTNCNVFYK